MIGSSNALELYAAAHVSGAEELQRFLFQNPELALEEHQASKHLRTALASQGFRLKELDYLTTAVVAEYGTDGPVIAILGEYDALDGPRGVGHRCGHHILCAGAYLAVMLIKDYLRENQVSGRIRFYGCPAEEIGEGKVLLTDHGEFDDVAAALTWHPDSTTTVVTSSTLAMQRMRFSFHGVSSHAASAPFSGRSALDAAELMNVGANFLREHISPFAQVQYSFLNAGGRSPNVVPDLAELEYVVRAPRSGELAFLANRVGDLARGAALMAGVRVTATHGSICKEVRPNHALSHLIDEVLRADTAERSLPEAGADYDHQVRRPATGGLAFVSSDLGNVSHAVPTAHFALTTWKAGTSLHSEGVLEQNDQRVTRRAFERAALVLARCAIRLFHEPTALNDALNEMSNAGMGAHDLD